MEQIIAFDGEIMDARVALADDEPDARSVLKRLLLKIGCEVTCAVEDGAKLVEFCDDESIDIAILDLDMPELDGLATAEEMTRRGIPVILVSGHPDLREIVVEQEPLVTALAKPISSAALENALKLALGSNR